MHFVVISLSILNVSHVARLLGQIWGRVRDRSIFRRSCLSCQYLKVDAALQNSGQVVQAFPKWATHKRPLAFHRSGGAVFVARDVECDLVHWLGGLSVHSFG